ncbi:unnamed protein product, partial [marine sediment metagenome]
EYESSIASTSLDIRNAFPYFYYLVNHGSWKKALFFFDDLQSVVEQYIASHPRSQPEKIREKIDSIRVTLATPSVDYWKRKAINLKLHDLVSSLIEIGAPLR